jgi:DinB superfamily
MNKEALSIIKNFETTLNGQPWFGRAVYILLDEMDSKKASVRPNENEHSALELIWHMNTWAEFTLANLENRSESELKDIEANDWRELVKQKHTWKKGLTHFKSIHKKIIANLGKRDDDFLSDMVPNRRYNFRFMLNGLIQHNIYHAGQLAYLKKLFG